MLDEMNKWQHKGSEPNSLSICSSWAQGYLNTSFEGINFLRNHYMNANKIFTIIWDFAASENIIYVPKYLSSVMQQVNSLVLIENHKDE